MFFQRNDTREEKNNSNPPLLTKIMYVYMYVGDPKVFARPSADGKTCENSFPPSKPSGGFHLFHWHRDAINLEGKIQVPLSSMQLAFSDWKIDLKKAIKQIF